MIQPLRHRNFALLWQGQVVSQFGNQAFAIATMFWMMEMTGSAMLMGTAMMLQTVPLILASPIAGVLADRSNRKHLLVAADLVSGVTVLGLAAWLMWGPRSISEGVAGILFASMTIGLMKALFGPAQAALIPDVVPPDEVAAANALNMASSQTASLAGQAGGGLLYTLWGAPLLFALDGISYLLSAASESLIQVSRPDVATPKAPLAKHWHTFLASIQEGLSFLAARPAMLRLLGNATVVNALVMPIIVLLPFHVSDALDADATWYGVHLAAFGAGSLLGTLGASRLSKDPHRSSLWLGGAFALAPLLLGVMGFMTSISLSMLLMTGAGAAAGLLNVMVITRIQLATPPELRGRVMSVVIAASGAATPIGMFAGGVMGDVLYQNTALIFMVCGGTAAAVSLFSLRSQVYRAILGGADDLYSQMQPPSDQDHAKP